MVETKLFENSIDFAQRHDEIDELRSFRENFYIPKDEEGKEKIYLCGNSLGLQPKAVEKIIFQELEDWQRLGVRGHMNARNPWVTYEELLTEPLAKIVGAKKNEVVAMNTLSVNLHLMMVSFYRPTKERYKIVIEENAFPSDQYAVKSQIKYHGFDTADGLIIIKPREGETIIRQEDINKLIEKEGDSISLCMLSGVNYYTGQFFNMKEITAKAHQKGCIVGFDLAHAVGNINLKLHDWNLDFAIWCSYKYLNGGPGAVGGCFVHERHANDESLPRFAGWWGHNKERRFLMEPDFDPIEGAEGWQLSNVPIFSTAPLVESLKIFNETSMAELNDKSTQLTGYLEFLINDIPTDRISIITPSDQSERGCQLSIRVKKADKNLYDQITEKGVICDWREPDVIRVAPTPLYNSFEDVFRFANLLKKNI